MEDPIPTFNGDSSLDIRRTTSNNNFRSSRIRTCKRCKFTTSDAKDFLHHQISVHSSDEVHNCDKCVFETTSLSDLASHRRFEHSKQTANTKEMDGLIGEANNNDPSLVKSASSSVLPPGDYLRNDNSGGDSTSPHQRAAPAEDGDGIEVYECGLCSYATTKSSDLRLHQQSHQIESVARHIASEHERHGIDHSPRSNSQRALDFEIMQMQRSYVAEQHAARENARADYLEADMEDDERRLVIDEDLMKSAETMRNQMPGMSPSSRPMMQPVPSPLIPVRNKPGPKPGSSSNTKPRTGCAPVREAVDPAKYITIQEPDGIKYACSKCGNIYKWRKSLNKHWKEKHEGELPDPRPNLTALNIPRLGKGYVTGLPNGKGNVITFMGSNPPSNPGHPATSAPPPTKNAFMAGGDMSYKSSAIRRALKRPTVTDSFSAGSPVNGIPSMAGPTMSKGGFMNKYHSTGSLHGSVPHAQPHKMSRLSNESALPQYADIALPFRGPESLPKHPTAIPQRRAPMDPTGPEMMLKNESFELPEGILDLSKKGTPHFMPKKASLPKIDMLPPQEEPLDFSMKTSTGTEVLVTSIKRDTEQVDGFGYVTEEIGSVGLQCPSCAYLARNKQDYDNHMELHLRKQHYKCAECQQVFTDIDELNEHFLNSHPDILQEKLLEMAAGGPGSKQNKMAESTQLYKYLTMDAQQQLLSCMVCGAIFQWQWTLSKHFEQDHHKLPNPYKKKSSSTVTSQGPVSPNQPLFEEEAYNLELSDRGDPNALRCTQCAFIATTSSELTRHQLKHSIGRQYICRICSYMTKWKDELLGHYKQDHPTANIDLNQIHAHMVAGPISQNHGQLNKLIDLTDEETAIVFPQAPEEDSDESPSAGSRSRFRQPRTPTTPTENASTEVILPFKCTICEYRARWPSEITQHMKNHSDEKPFHCPRCSYKSKWKWDVVKHLKRCGGGTVNDVIDTTKGGHGYCLQGDGHSPDHKRMSHHRELLSNGPPNVTVMPSGEEHMSLNLSRNSDAMDARSPQSSHGGDGMETDPNGQAYHVCLHCPFMGNSPAELKRHSRVHSDEKPFICKTCGYCSKWKCDLKKHLRTYNHTSAVPLTYGGHGRKPSEWKDKGIDGDDSNDGEKADTEDDSPTKFEPKELYQCDKCQYVTYKRIAMESHMKIHSSKQSKLKCKQCDYEASDLSSFLQHKRTHSATLENEPSTPVISATQILTPETASPVTKHRRKALKQNRIIKDDDDQDADEDYPDFDQEYGNQTSSPKPLPIVTVSPITQEDKTQKTGIAKSLAYRCVSCPYTTDNKSNYEKHIKFHNTNNKYVCEWCNWSIDRLNLLYRHAQTVHPNELAAQEKETFYGKVKGRESSECIMKESIDDDEDTENEDGSSTRMTWSKRQDMSNIEKRRLEFRRESSGLEEDASVECGTKRRRRLKTCQKCGYITDNVTTLQRHMAKHGGSGKFTCNYCDYSVDRQHIVDYHIKIVHEAGDMSVIKSPCSDAASDGQSPEGSADELDQEMEDLENDESHQDDDYLESDYNEDDVVSQITKIKGIQMKVQMAGRKTTYHCLSCPYSAGNITNAVSHMKRHGQKKKYTCELCDYSLDQLRHVMQHMKKVHGHDVDTSFDDIGDDTSFPNEVMSEDRENKIFEDINSNHDFTQSSTGPKKGLKNGSQSPTPTKTNGHTRFHCTLCHFVAQCQASFHRHMEGHKRFGNKLQCKNCNYRATTTRLLQTHIKSHHTK